MTKPELLITAGSSEEAKRYIAAGADAVNIGDARFSLRMPGRMSAEDVRETIIAVHQQGAKVYVAVNNIMGNEDLLALESYLQSLAGWGADAVVFGDPAVLRLVRTLELPLSLHWNAEMTATNYTTANFWIDQGVDRIILARELNLEEVHEAQREIRGEVQVQVHGMTNIYHSKRELITSYMEHNNNNQAVDSAFGVDKGLYLIEHERRNLHLPIYEDDHGTHIMSPDDICMIENLDELLEVTLDSLKIEGLLKSVEYNETVVRMYRTALDAYCANPQHYEFLNEWFLAIERIQEKTRELSYGFYFKEQVY